MSMIDAFARHSVVLSSCSLLVTAAAGPRIAAAQEPSLEEVVVTGSRIQRSGFDTTQPVSVIDSEQIEDLGIVNVGDVLRRLPQNSAFFTETNVGIGNFNVGAQLANLRGLNPFFGTRTLTLVDTRRVVPNSEGGAVDLTLIPSMLVARTEVVTGGASAAYGSDAIAGVVNVILDTNLEGFKAQVDYGQTSESDGSDTHASFAFGTGFGDEDRGHLLVGAELQNQDAIGPCAYNRDWCRDSWGVGTNASPFPTVPDYNTPAGVGNGLPNFVIASNGLFPTSDTGLFAPLGGAVQQFSADGTALLPYNPGQFPGLFARFGGDGTLSAYSISNIRPEVERLSVLGHVSYDLTDSLEFFAEVANAQSDAVSDPANGAWGPLPIGPGMFIQPDNAFLSPAIQAAAPLGGFFTRSLMPNEFSANNTTENDTLRFVTGLNGDLSENWNWDAYYQYGNNENEQRLFHNVVGGVFPAFVRPYTYDFLGFAVDAVRSNPADPNSPIVCRQTLLGNPLAAGCVPLNLFGNGNTTPAAIDYVYRTLKEDTEYDQNVAGANFRGNLAAGWAGPIDGAFGVEWRQDEYLATHDIPNQPWYNDYFLTWGLDRGGKIDVAEVYGEIQIPIVESLQTDLAVRETRHEATSIDAASGTKSHTFSSWKAAAIYDPLDWLRFRGTRSQDVRAAGFRELFLPRLSVIGAPFGFPGGINNPWNSNIAESYTNISGGNPDLEPETADTTALGVVLSFERFRFSVDWYEIDMKDAITPGGLGGLSAQNVVDACFRGGSAACAKVGGYGTTDITSVDASSINIGSFLAKGYDLEANVNFAMSQGGNVNLRAIASYLYEMTIDTGLGNPPQDYHGQSGPVGSFGGFNTSPDWQATAWLTYTRDRFATTFETRYVGSGTLNALWFDSPPGTSTNTLPFSVTDNSVEDRYYLSWSGSFGLLPSGDRSVELFWAFNNLLDEDPPIAPGGNLYPTNPVFFDTIGGRFRAGVRVEF
jgi:outer membrane receptor protein involved in Fe transport